MKDGKRNWTGRNRIERIWIAAGLLVVVFVLVLSMMALILGKTSEVQAKDKSTTRYESVLIEEGDTLWTIAEQYKSVGEKTGSALHRIAKLNGIRQDEKLVAGCYLVVPVQEYR